MDYRPWALKIPGMSEMSENKISFHEKFVVVFAAAAIIGIFLKVLFF